MTLPNTMLKAIGEAVQNAGGDLTDVEDLIRAWQRLEHDWQPRVDRIRHQARTIRCCCADGGQPDDTGQCQRCYGKAANRATPNASPPPGAAGAAVSSEAA